MTKTVARRSSRRSEELARTETARRRLRTSRCASRRSLWKPSSRRARGGSNGGSREYVTRGPVLARGCSFLGERDWRVRGDGCRRYFLVARSVPGRH
ncbi:predicted protein [Micromonas commoda]|uniref:Uncharacterized protein n=1 Tax=Micromonas commoda (strain RCC299 / NOUM17 / CCMP2709) TaxID=296587 RepID=C1EE13_MICCC|nr:predicted protein [Micromonas commoda]ACO66153.1 predicted protein [Micromonas commoda]|eukprot:XP_002504895.1 predicted protein [Micromonas commoda]